MSQGTTQVTADALVAHQQTLYESRNATRRWLHNSRRSWIHRAVLKWCPQGERALEIGPGSGIYVPLLKKVCPEVWLADCEQAYLAAIEKRCAGDRSLKIVVDDITASRLPAEHFDLILCTEVVEHITDSKAALRHMARALKPTGVLVLSTPQRYSSMELAASLALSPGLIWLTRAIYRESVEENGHINLMTERQVKAQIAAAELDILQQDKSGLYLPLVAELMGGRGKSVAERLESKISGSWLDAVLWTQYYVLKRSHVV